MLLLEELQISSTGVADLTPLTPLKRLGSLSASNAKLTDLSPLEHLSQLRVLLFEGNEIKDAHPIAALQLEYLQIKKYQIEIIKGHRSRNKLIEINA